MNDVQSREEVLVSVVMITYNHEKYISKAIESVLMQKTSFRYELLIGDDASKDKTPEIIRGYKEQNPEIIKIKLRKRNVGGTRNSYELFMNAKGKYIAILEGDDYWTDELKLQKQFDFLEKNERYSGSCCDFVFIDKEGKPYPENGANRLRKNLYADDEVFTVRQLNQSKLPSHAGTMMIRNFFGEFDCTVLYKAHRIIGDCTIVMLALSCGEIYKLPEKMEAYRVALGTSSWTSSESSNPFLCYELFMYYTYLETFARKNSRFDCEIDFRNAKSRYFYRCCIEYANCHSKARKHSIYNMLLNTSKKYLYLRVLAEAKYFARIPTTIVDGLIDKCYLQFPEEKWETFNKIKVGRNIVLVGAGAGLRNFFEQYYHKYRINLIVDNNADLYGKYVYGCKVVPFDELSHMSSKKTVILITTNDTYIDILRQQCEKYGMKYIFSYVHMECKESKYDLFRLTYENKVYLRNI